MIWSQHWTLVLHKNTKYNTIKIFHTIPAVVNPQIKMLMVLGGGTFAERLGLDEIIWGSPPGDISDFVKIVSVTELTM